MSEFSRLPKEQVPPGHTGGIEVKNGRLPVPEDSQVSMVMPVRYGAPAMLADPWLCTLCAQDCWVSINAEPDTDGLVRVCYDCLDKYEPGWREMVR